MLKCQQKLSKKKKKKKEKERKEKSLYNVYVTKFHIAVKWDKGKQPKVMIYINFDGFPPTSRIAWSAKIDLNILLTIKRTPVIFNAIKYLAERIGLVAVTTDSLHIRKTCPCNEYPLNTANKPLNA